jgi:hypothetical protein
MELLKMGDFAEEARFLRKHIQGIRNPERSSTNISRALRRQQILSPAAGKVIALLAAS